MSDDRPSVYMEDGVAVYRASSLGHCLRALMAARRGMEPLPFPDFMYDRFEEGNVAEPLIMSRFSDDNPDFTLLESQSQDQIVLNISDNVVVRGHIDGMALDSNGRSYLVEAKALGPDWFKKFKKHGFAGLPDAYAWQVSIYMLALGTTNAVLVAGQKIDGVIKPESEFHYEWIRKPLFDMDQIFARVMSVENNVESSDWPDCLNEWLCQYPYLHDEPEFEQVTGSDATMLDSFAELWAEASDMEKRAKAIKASIKSDLDKLVADMSLSDTTSNKFRSDKWQVTLVEEQVPEQTMTRSAYTKRYPRFKNLG